MEPMIDELAHAWEEGIWTYDRAIKKNFKMHVWYHYSLHDFLAYGIFCRRPRCGVPQQGSAGEGRVLGKSPSHNIAQYVAFIGLFLK